MSTAYHPQKDDQTKVFIAVLCSFVHENNHIWYSFYIGQNGVTTLLHTALQDFLHFSLSTENHHPVPQPIFAVQQKAVDFILKTRDDSLEILKTNLSKAQNMMKQITCKKRSYLLFCIGDWAYQN